MRSTSLRQKMKTAAALRVAPQCRGYLPTMLITPCHWHAARRAVGQASTVITGDVTVVTVRVLSNFTAGIRQGPTAPVPGPAPVRPRVIWSGHRQTRDPPAGPTWRRRAGRRRCLGGLPAIRRFRLPAAVPVCRQSSPTGRVTSQVVTPHSRVVGVTGRLPPPQCF